MLRHVLTLCHSANCCPEIHFDDDRRLFVLTDDFGARIEVKPDELGSPAVIAQEDAPADRRVRLEWSADRALQMSQEQSGIFRDALQNGGTLEQELLALA